MEKNLCFIDKFSFEERLKESFKIKSRYRTSAPIIVEPKDEKTMKIDKCKFLVPWDLEYGQFLYVIRKRLKIDPEHAIFMFCDNVIPNNTDTILHIYKKMGHSDGFLYFKYSFENTFG